MRPARHLTARSGRIGRRRAAGGLGAAGPWRFGEEQVLVGTVARGA